MRQNQARIARIERAQLIAALQGLAEWYRGRPQDFEDALLEKMKDPAYRQQVLNLFHSEEFRTFEAEAPMLAHSIKVHAYGAIHAHAAKHHPFFSKAPSDDGHGDVHVERQQQSRAKL